MLIPKQPLQVPHAVAPLVAPAPRFAVGQQAQAHAQAFTILISGPEARLSGGAQRALPLLHDEASRMVGAPLQKLTALPATGPGPMPGGLAEPRTDEPGMSDASDESGPLAHDTSVRASARLADAQDRPVGLPRVEALSGLAVAAGVNDQAGVAPRPVEAPALGAEPTPARVVSSSAITSFGSRSAAAVSNTQDDTAVAGSSVPADRVRAAERVGPDPSAGRVTTAAAAAERTLVSEQLAAAPSHGRRGTEGRQMSADAVLVQPDARLGPDVPVEGLNAGAAGSRATQMPGRGLSTHQLPDVGIATMKVAAGVPTTTSGGGRELSVHPAHPDGSVPIDSRSSDAPGGPSAAISDTASAARVPDPVSTMSSADDGRIMPPLHGGPGTGTGPVAPLAQARPADAEPDATATDSSVTHPVAPATRGPAPAFDRQTNAPAPQHPVGTEALASPGVTSLAHSPDRNHPTAAGAAMIERMPLPDSAIASAMLPQAVHVSDRLVKPAAGAPATIVTQVLTRVEASLSVALVVGDERRIEIRLDPPELGTVRMVMSMSDHGLTMHVFADRGDTLDLLRRHVTQLVADLARMGFGSAEFSFHEGGSDTSARDPGGRDRSADTESLARQPPLLAERSAGRTDGASGLDLRI